jgi:predicted DNA-binding protein (MmcQ/YjbR family)
MTRQDLIDFCLSFSAVYEDYPFDKVKDGTEWAVMRNKNNKKSFALIYVRNDKLCINLKCEPNEADFLRGIFRDVIPAYHMNKTHWNTVFADGDVPEAEIKNMIRKSYDLIKPKEKKRK